MKKQQAKLCRTIGCWQNGKQRSKGKKPRAIATRADKLEQDERDKQGMDASKKDRRAQKGLATVVEWKMRMEVKHDDDDDAVSCILIAFRCPKNIIFLFPIVTMALECIKFSCASFNSTQPNGSL